MDSQKEIVLNHLRNIGPLSQLECTKRYLFTRLSAIVFDLRKDGHEIMMNRKSSKNGKSYGEYQLCEGQQDLFGGQS